MTARTITILQPDQPIPRRGPFVLTVPGHLAPVQHFDLPNRVKGAARLGIARQQMADRLGTAANRLAVLPLGDSTDWAAAVVCDPADVAAICNSDAARHKRCRAVVPDMLTLPFAPETLVIDTTADSLRARTDAHDGFAAPLSLAPALLSGMLADAGEAAPKHVHFLTPPPDVIRTAITAAGLTEVPLQPAANPPPYPDLRNTLASNAGRDLWLWGLAAALAVLAFGLWAAGLALETRNLQHQAAEVRAKTVAVLRNGLIPQGPVLDIRQQVAQAQANRAGSARAAGATPAALLSRVSVGLFGTGITVGAIRLDTTISGLEVAITAGSFAEIDTLVAQLTDSGLRVDARDMRNQPGSGVTARLIILAEDRA